MRPRFEGGSLLEPATIIVCGFATRGDDAVISSDLAVHAARRYLAEHLLCDPGVIEIN